MRRKLGARDYARYRIAARKAGDEIYKNGDVRTEFRAAMYAADREESRRKKLVVALTGGLGLLLIGTASGFMALF